MESMGEFEAAQRDNPVAVGPYAGRQGGSLLFPPKKPEGAKGGLHQGAWWVDARGEWLRIDEMSYGYVENVMALLRSRATTLAIRETWPMYAYAINAPDMAADAIEQEIRVIERDPLAWLKTTKLYRALKRRRKYLKKAMENA